MYNRAGVFAAGLRLLLQLYDVSRGLTVTLEQCNAESCITDLPSAGP